MIKAIPKSAAEQYQLSSKYESLRETLLERHVSEHLEKPLAYWALPTDRRLPLALIGQPLGELLSTNFDKLLATPGIGRTKMRSLLTLLTRAANHEALPQFELAEGNGNGHAHTLNESPPESYDPSTVSEVHWSKWQATVREHKAGGAKLGCLAPSLRAMPTVVWHTPLEFYLDKSLVELRGLKTHGEKRVRAVLEVFYTVHTMLSRLGAENHIAVRLLPRFVPPIEAWICNVVAGDTIPTPDQMREQLVTPMLAQIDIDATETHCRLAAQRLAIDGSGQSVRGAARRLGVTRARVYQLLEDCGRIMQVRWPDGRDELGKLSEHIHAVAADSDADRLCQLARDLFYPAKLDSRSSA